MESGDFTDKELIRTGEGREHIGMEGAKQWLGLTPALSSRRGRTFRHLTDEPAIALV
jgi:hypothetical protein